MTETCEQVVARLLEERYVAEAKRLGWWCPHCEVLAPPDVDITNPDAPGWCDICGWTP